jgi:D-arabinose 5-phosphate isomerase GutQ
MISGRLSSLVLHSIEAKKALKVKIIIITENPAPALKPHAD